MWYPTYLFHHVLREKKEVIFPLLLYPEVQVLWEGQLQRLFTLLPPPE